MSPLFYLLSKIFLTITLTGIVGRVVGENIANRLFYRYIRCNALEKDKFSRAADRNLAFRNGAHRLLWFGALGLFFLLLWLVVFYV